MRIDCFIKAKDINTDIAKDVETKFDIANVELEKPLSREKSKEVLGLMNDQIVEKIMMDFVALRQKTC